MPDPRSFRNGALELQAARDARSITLRWEAARRQARLAADVAVRAPRGRPVCGDQARRIEADPKLANWRVRPIAI